MKTVEVVRRHLEEANHAARAHTAAMLSFQTACVCGDWEAAESARVQAQESLNAHLDAVKAAHMVMKSAV